VCQARYANGWGGLENLEKAQSSYEAALRSSPSSARARRGLIYLDWERGSSERCLSRGREAARFGAPNDVEALLAQAEAYQLCGLPDRSVPLLERALEIDPRNQAAQFRLVISLTWSGDRPRAIEAGQAYFASFGDDPEIHVWVGVSQHLLGHVEPAWEHYQKAIEWKGRAEGSVLRALYYAGFLFDTNGKPERAREIWERGVELTLSRLKDDPEQVRLRFYLACFNGLLHQDGFSQEKGRALESSDLNAVEMRYLAIVHAWRGDEARAVAILRDALRRGRLDSAWKVGFAAASVSWQNATFAPFVREHRELEERLRRMY